MKIRKINSPENQIFQFLDSSSRNYTYLIKPDSTIVHLGTENGFPNKMI